MTAEIIDRYYELVWKVVAAALQKKGNKQGQASANNTSVEPN
jgi:hypothetical protein